MFNVYKNEAEFEIYTNLPIPLVNPPKYLYVYLLMGMVRSKSAGTGAINKLL